MLSKKNTFGHDRLTSAADIELTRVITSWQVGATASLQEAVTGGWPLLIFILLLLTVHVAFIAVLGSKVFKLPIRSVLIASNANVGGPATAAAMASAKGWPEMVRTRAFTPDLCEPAG